MRSSIIINTLRFEVYRISRSPGLLMQIAVGLLFVGIAVFIESVSEAILQEFRNSGPEGLPIAVIMATAKLQTLGVESNPLFLVYGYAVQLLIPGIALTLGANQITEDLSSGHSRILLSRMTRTELLTGRFLSTWTQWALVGGVTCAWGASILSTNFNSAGNSSLTTAMLFGGSAIIYGAPFLAYGSALNTVFRTPLSVLIGGCGIWLGWSWALGKVLDALPPSALANIPSFLATSAGEHLLIHGGGNAMAGVLLCAAYTAFFLFCGVQFLKRKELR